MEAPLERRLRNDFGALAAVAREVREHLARNAAGKRVTHAVDLALEELVSNTIRHGYDGGQPGQMRDDARPARKLRFAIESTADDGAQ